MWAISEWKKLSKKEEKQGNKKTVFMAKLCYFIIIIAALHWNDV